MLPATTSLPVLLRKYRDAHRQYVELERVLADLDHQIVAAGRPSAKPRRRAEPIAANDELRAVLRVLQEAEAPLPPREIASRLSVETAIVSRRLARARRLGYVEQVGRARYRVASAVPSL
jgi:chromatin segregation and condensation protein Rec8/ScpA/Scc1 (kleisin family)